MLNKECGTFFLVHSLYIYFKELCDKNQISQLFKIKNLKNYKTIKMWS